MSLGLASAALAGCATGAPKKVSTAVSKADGGGDKRMRGPFPILSTPYNADGSVDFGSLKRGVRFTADGGCPGVIWCQSNDAVDLLTFDEKVKGYEASSDELEVYNGLQGSLQLAVYGTGIPGLNWHLTAPALKAGERSVLKLSYNPPDKSPKESMEIKIGLEPLGVQVPIKIVFDIPESVKRQLPAAVRP